MINLYDAKKAGYSGPFSYTAKFAFKTEGQTLPLRVWAGAGCPFLRNRPFDWEESE